jgi:NitT/TauT family transport system substrate-binding protein
MHPKRHAHRIHALLRSIFLLAIFVTPWGAAQTLRVGLGYLPNIQFAPFYTAAREGFYEDEGITVEFQHGFSTELFPLLAQGQLEFVVSDAEDAISLRALDPEGARFVYVMALYQRVPNALFSLAEAGIVEPQDIAGKTIGLPGLFGTSYTAFLALLRTAGLEESDVTVQQIGFTQLEAVASGRVDAAMGFINNEPLILGRQGIETQVIPVGPLSPALGSGVVTSETVLEDADLVQRFLRATRRGLELTLGDPERAVTASKEFIPDLSDDTEAELEVLNATLPLYSSPYSRTNGLGAINPQKWQAFIDLLRSSGQLETDLPADTFYSNDYLPR